MYFILASVPAWSVITERERERERDFGHMSLPVTSLSSSFHRVCADVYHVASMGCKQDARTGSDSLYPAKQVGVFRPTVVAHGRESPLAGIILAGYFIGA